MESVSEFLLNNPEFLLDETRLRNALHDFYATDIASMNLMMMAYHCIDIPKQAQKDHPHLDIEKENWKKRLRYNYSVKSDKASWAVDQWIVIFCNELKQRLIEIVNQQQVKQRQLVSLRQQVEQLIEEEKYSEAEDILNEICNQSDSDDTIKGLWAEIDRVKRDTKSQKQQALDEYGNGLFDSYNKGIEKISHILDICPDFQQAQIWLRNNPREKPINTPIIMFTEGSSQCTISWKDDDPYSKYTVCRAIGHHPQDPNDGYCVCSEISNTKVTDNLPLNQPGSVWKYSVFAVRILDKQWIKTDCINKEVAWLPNPSDFKVELGKDKKGRPIITLSWRITADNCQGVHIIRKDNDNNPFMYSSSILDVDSTSSTKSEAQSSCCFIDEDVYSNITYRYLIKQVWKTGITPLESSGVSLEITVQ